MAAQFIASRFTASTAKPLPVILLLDTSGSMNIVVNPDEVRRTGQTAVVDGQTVEYVTGGKSRIDVLNEAVRTMLSSFRKEESLSTEFLVSVVTFGKQGAQLAQAPASASSTVYSDLAADGATPLGRALKIAKDLVENRDTTPSRSYRPLVVLVSDGEPNDSWEGPLADFIRDGRSAKCDRMALGIGTDAISGRGRKALERFIEGTDGSLFEAADAGKIHEFFQFVTMSVVTRGQSQNPNELPTRPAPSISAVPPAPPIPPRPAPAASPPATGARKATVVDVVDPTEVTPWRVEADAAHPTVVLGGRDGVPTVAEPTVALGSPDHVPTVAQLLPATPAAVEAPATAPATPAPAAAVADDEDDYW